MFTTCCPIHISPTYEFKFFIINNPLCKRTRSSIFTIHTESRKFSYLTSQWNTVNKFTKLSLKRISIKTCEYYFFTVLRTSSGDLVSLEEFMIKISFPITFRRLSRRISSDVLPENIFPIIIDKPISLINIILYFLYG